MICIVTRSNDKERESRRISRVDFEEPLVTLLILRRPWEPVEDLAGAGACSVPLRGTEGAVQREGGNGTEGGGELLGD